MDLRKLKKLIDLVQESGIAELEITEGEEKVKIVKGGVVSVSGVAPAIAAPAAEVRPAAAPAPAAAPPAGANAAAVSAPGSNGMFCARRDRLPRAEGIGGAGASTTTSRPASGATTLPRRVATIKPSVANCS